MKSSLIYKVIIIGLLGMLLACSGKEADAPTETPETNQIRSVTITEAQFRETGIKLGPPDTLTLGDMIQATGKVEAPPDHWATVHAPMGGYVRATRLVEGDFVRKGQVLAVLEHPDYVKLQQEYLQALTRSRFEQQELDRQTELAREEVGARRKLQESTAAYETTRALLTSLEAQLAQLHLPLVSLRRGTISRTITLLAPISGYVDKVNLRLGQYVGPTDGLVEIVNKDHLYLELRVFESDIRKVREGQRVMFSVTQQQTGPLEAVVYRVGQSFDDETRTVLVHANLKVKDYGRLFAGSYVRATIQANPRQVLALPEDAIVQEGNRAYVYVRQRGKASGEFIFTLVPIQAGVTQNHRTEVILSKETDPAAIVRQGAYFISAERAKMAG